MRPYLIRQDNYWLDYEKEQPYPAPELGTSLEDHYARFMFEVERRGLTNNDAEYVCVAPDKLNPYAVGHMINHPPPDTPANCLLIDFDLPYSFFPSHLARYIPYINYRTEERGGYGGGSGR